MVALPLLETVAADTLEGHLHGQDVAVLVELQKVDARNAVVAVGRAQRVTVIDDIILAAAGVVNHRVVTRTRSHILIRAQDHALAHEGAQRVVRHGIRHTVVGARPAPLRPHEVILAVADEHERSLDITLGRNLLEGLAVVEGDEPAAGRHAAWRHCSGASRRNTCRACRPCP